MRPEQFRWSNSLSAKRVKILAGVLLAVIIFHAEIARTTESASQTPAVPIYDAESFIKELARLKNGLESARKSTETLQAYRESLPEAWAVDAGGSHYDVPTDLLASRILSAEKHAEIRGQQLDQARDYLDALATETASAAGQSPASTDAARVKLNAILARSEYAHTRQQSWWEKIRARINEIILNAIERVLHRMGGEASLGYILLWIAICAAAVLIAYWIFRRWFRTARMEEMALQAATVPVRSWQQWIFAAREASASGDYRLAVYCAYWAGIARLQDLGTLAPDRAKTPREYLGALTKSKLILPDTLATRQQALTMLTARLEKIWYGYHVATEADFRDSLIQLETLGCRLP